MNLPTRAQDAHATLAAAFNTGDVNTVLSMYDYDGIIVPEPGKAVSGKEEFEEAIKIGEVAGGAYQQALVGKKKLQP